MIELNQIYKCSICGNIVEIKHVGGGTLTCCNQPMNLISENTVEASTEKHIPVITVEGDVVKVSVGSINHPMEENHYIEWVELVTDSRISTKYLKPGDEPKVEFKTKCTNYTVRAYCNIHGLWSSKN